MNPQILFIITTRRSERKMNLPNRRKTSTSEQSNKKKKLSRITARTPTPARKWTTSPSETQAPQKRKGSQSQK